jgi:hypothetical protein
MTDGATYTVTVNVTGSGAGTTVVDLIGPNYNSSDGGTTPNFSVYFSGVPDGDYTARAVYGNTTVEGYVTVAGADASVDIAMGLE